MDQQSIGKVRQLSLLGVALLSLLVGSSAANAAVYAGRWDPLFNSTFSADVGQDVGWKGTTTVTVDDGCLIPSSTQSVPSGSCLSATMDNATLTFYNLNTNATIGGIAWPGAGLIPPISQVGIDASSNLNGIDLSAPLTGLTSIFGPQYSVALDFSLIGASLTLTGACPSTTNSTNRLLSFAATQQCPYQSETTPPVTWTRVPEPAPLALIGIALAALGLSRQRIRHHTQV